MDSTTQALRASLQDNSPVENPADLCATIVRQGHMIRVYQDQVAELQAANAQLRQQPTAADAPEPAAPSCSGLPRFSLPEKFDGSADRCCGFLRQCDNFFVQQPEIYGNETIRCAFMLSLLMGKALDWASAIWDADPQVTTSADYFTNLIREVFEYLAGGKDISVQLFELHQKLDTAADFAIKFRKLAAQSGWNKTALIAVFHESLNPDLKAKMACRENNATLSQYISTVIRLDNLRRQHRPTAFTPRSKPRHLTEFHSPREETAEPMQQGRSRVSKDERECRTQLWLYFYCGQPNHRVFQCLLKPTTSQVEIDWLLKSPYWPSCS